MLATTLPVVAASDTSNHESYQLVWQDNFSSDRLNPAIWTLQRYRRDSAQLSPDAVTVDQEGLHIHTYTTADIHYTGFVTTRTLFGPYGLFEARIRFHGAPAPHCAFWLQSPTMGRDIGNPGHAGVETDIV